MGYSDRGVAGNTETRGWRRPIWSSYRTPTPALTRRLCVSYLPSFRRRQPIAIQCPNIVLSPSPWPHIIHVVCCTCTRLPVLTVQRPASIISTPTLRLVLVLVLRATGITFRNLLCSSAFRSYKYCVHHIAPSPFSIFSGSCSATYVQINPVLSSTTAHTIQPPLYYGRFIYHVTGIWPNILSIRFFYPLHSVVQSRIPS